jgi:hypothetical protein
MPWRRAVVMVVLIASHASIGLAQSGTIGNWQLTEAINLHELAEQYGTEIGRDVVLSPDGNLLAWTTAGSAICVGTISEPAATCYPVEETRVSDLYWSPDSRFIATHENVVQQLLEGDIWLFEVATGQITNLTDDGVTDFRDDGALLDITPVWDPATNGLYFFRAVDDPANDRFTNGLYRIAAQDGVPTGEPELVADLSSQFERPFPVYNSPGQFALNGSAAISPDGTTMAVLTRPALDDIDIWLIDLAGGALDHVAAWENIKTLGVPVWSPTDGDVPEGLAWMPDNQGLIVVDINTAFGGPTASPLARYIDIMSGAVTPLVDFSGVPDAPTFLRPAADSTGLSINDLHRNSVLLRDGTALLYFNAAFVYGGETNPAFSALSLPPDGSDLVELIAFDWQTFDFDPRYYITSVGGSGDILHVLAAGHLLTFEQAE